MTLPQASAVPIKNGDSIETVTLKNLVALDLVEKNENLLKAFNLLDDSKSKIITLGGGSSGNNEELQKLIELKKAQIAEQQEELKILKKQISEHQNKDNELINKLASDFLKDEITNDDSDQLIKQFERENNVKVFFNKKPDHHEFINIDLGIGSATKPEPQPQQLQPEPQVQPTPVPLQQQQ